MGRRKVTYYQVFCDYPTHGSHRELPKGAPYKVFNDDKVVVCDDCWDNKLVLEALLKLLKIEVTSDKVGYEYFNVGG